MLRFVLTRRPTGRLLATCTALLAMLAMGSSSALAQQAQPVTVTATEYAFSPKSVTLHVGEPVQLVLQNNGKDDHNLSSDEIPISNVTYQRADNDPAELQQYQAQNVLDMDVKAGATSRVTFTPTRAGSYQFTSGEGDDEQKGMVGTFSVLAPGALPNTGDDPRPENLAWLAVLVGALLVTGGAVMRRRAHSGTSLR
jgi:plastocyanin